MATKETVFKVSKDDIKVILQRKYNIEIVTLTMSSQGIKCVLK